MEEAKKADSGKPQLDLLPREGIEQIARVLEYGNRKYGVGNYKKGRAWRRDAGAILRHVFAWLDGEDLDPESGLSHLAHAGCGVLFLLEYLKTHPELDNRAGEVTVGPPKVELRWPSCCPGPPQNPIGPPIGPGWRELKKGERLQEGDVHWWKGEYRPTVSAGQHWYDGNGPYYRREA